MEKLPKLINSQDNSAIIINNLAFTIGRSLSCNHIIQSLDVSRFHCMIRKQGQKWVLFDRSTNGTIVNSKKIKFNESVDLKHGDVIKLGPEMSFVFTDTVENRPENEIVKETACSSKALFPNDEKLLEEAASLLAEGLEEPPPEIELAASKTSQKDPNEQSTSKCKTEPGLDLMENELTCSICSELFIKAVTLNCAHSFCRYCVDQWRKSKNTCPICRQPITTLATTLVLDNFIEKVINMQSDETKRTRSEIVKQREEAAASDAASSSNVRRDAVIEITSEDEDFDGEESELGFMSDEYDDDDDDEDDDDEDDYQDRDYNKRRMAPYYGGYGSCFICNEPGHWANGCPTRRR